MIRRDLLKTSAFGIAAAFASGALAQTSTQTPAQTPAPMSNQTQGQMAPAAGSPEAKHIADTLAVGTMSLEASRLAASKADKPKIKQFANFEVAEQTAIADVLKMTGGAAPAAMPADAAAMVKKLQSESGASFDREYIKGQMDGHQKLLSIQEAYLSSGKNPMNITVAKLASAQIKEHLALLADLEKGGTL